MKNENGLFEKIEAWILAAACGLVITIPAIAGICNNFDSSRHGNAGEVEEKIKEQKAEIHYPLIRAQEPIQFQTQEEFEAVKKRLAGLMFREARGEKSTDKERIAIGYSLVNRANDGKKHNGETIDEVIFKKSQYPTHKINEITKYEREIWNKCNELAEGILTGRYKDPLGATNYHAWYKSPEWVKAPNMILLGRYGEHKFYREI